MKKKKYTELKWDTRPSNIDDIAQKKERKERERQPVNIKMVKV